MTRCWTRTGFLPINIARLAWTLNDSNHALTDGTGHMRRCEYSLMLARLTSPSFLEVQPLLPTPACRRRQALMLPLLPSQMALFLLIAIDSL